MFSSSKIGCLVIKSLSPLVICLNNYWQCNHRETRIQPRLHIQLEVSVDQGRLVGEAGGHVPVMDATFSTPHLKFYFCRWSQVLLMIFIAALCVFQMYVLVISYSAVYHVPISSKPCGPDHLKFSVDLTNAKNSKTSENNGEFGNNSLQETYEGNNSFQNTLNTTLEIDNVLYPAGYIFPNNDTFRGCPCLLKTCIIKCCPFNQRFASRTNLTCIPEKSASTFKPFRESIFSKLDRHQQLSDLHSKKMNESDIFVIVGERCDKNKGKYGSRYDIKKSFMMEDGTVLTDQLIYLDLNQYCMDRITGTEKMITVRCVKNDLDFVIRRSVTGVRYRAVIGVLVISVVSLLPSLKATEYKLTNPAQTVHLVLRAWLGRSFSSLCSDGSSRSRT
ncbi:hypothetical protein J6590_078138 [Homalodisca vitripennis]|nr:hypothetical protein J6590_078138 [Homalodisca vitripennis]